MGLGNSLGNCLVAQCVKILHEWSRFAQCTDYLPLLMDLCKCVLFPFMLNVWHIHECMHVPLGISQGFFAAINELRATLG